MELRAERGLGGCPSGLVVREGRLLLGGRICPWEPGEQGGMEQVVGEGTACL